ncbi:DUF4034 domain-containing protein [Undibacterium squillarum]|uniref:DUF4034 domain-containing protein n=1 Tax=Undibacterium squillarum TaxID=1131567 RepID=UPI0035B466DF
MSTHIEKCKILFRGQRFSELDQFLETMQSGYEQGNISELVLTETFNVFCSVDPSYETKLEAYLLVYPNSYSANLAYGIYCIEYGWTKRGYDFADKLSETQIRGFIAYLQLADEHLRRSLQHAKKPILSYVQLMIIAMGIGEQQDGDKLNFYRAGLECAPDCLGVRKQYLRTLRVQWGGSFKEMSDFVSDKEHTKLSRQNYSQFIASKHFIDAHYYFVIERHTPYLLVALVKGLFRLTHAKILSLT